MSSYHHYHSSAEHLHLVSQVKQRNAASINPHFWTPDTVAMHRAWWQRGQVETQAVTIVEIEESEQENQAFIAFVRQPAFFEFLQTCDDWGLQDKNGDWSKPMRLFVAWTNEDKTVALDLNRTTLEGGIPVLECVVHLVRDVQTLAA